MMAKTQPNPLVREPVANDSRSRLSANHHQQLVTMKRHSRVHLHNHQMDSCHLLLLLWSVSGQQQFRRLNQDGRRFRCQLLSQTKAMSSRQCQCFNGSTFEVLRKDAEVRASVYLPLVGPDELRLPHGCSCTRLRRNCCRSVLTLPLLPMPPTPDRRHSPGWPSRPTTMN